MDLLLYALGAEYVVSLTVGSFHRLLMKNQEKWQ